MIKKILSKLNVLYIHGVLLEKLTGSAASQEIPCIFRTQRFITVLTSARHLSQS